MKVDKDMTDQKPRKKMNFNWFFWWRINPEELQRQISEYKTLKIYQSARGLSFLYLIFAALVTGIFILLSVLDQTAFIDIVLFLVIGLFVFRGHRWAIIMAMVVWTFEKCMFLIASIEASNPSLIQIVWWTIYMQAFYLAFKVERARQKRL